MKDQNLKLVTRLFKHQDNNYSYEIQLVKNTAGKKFLTKKVTFKKKNLKYKRIANEAKALKIFAKYHKDNFPTLYSIGEKDNQLQLTREYIEGKKVKGYPAKFKLELMLALTKTFKKLSREISPQEANDLTKRTTWEVFCAFPFYFVKALAKEPKESLFLFRNFYLFYLNFISPNVFRPNYQLAHKDIHPDNIVIRQNKAYLLDLEFASLAEAETDLAIMCRYFSSDLKSEDLKKLIYESANDLKQFIRLSVFYTIKLIAAEPKNEGYYKQAKNYLEIFPTKIVGSL